MKWKIKDATEVLNVTEKNIYFRTKKNEILCVDRKYGQEQWRWSIKNSLEVVGSLTDDAIYVVDKTIRDGDMTIYALTERGNLPKVEDKESLVDVGYFYYDDIDKEKEAKIKDELEKAEKAKKAAEGKPDDNAADAAAQPGDKKEAKPKAEKKPNPEAPAKKDAEPKEKPEEKATDKPVEKK